MDRAVRETLPTKSSSDHVAVPGLMLNDPKTPSTLPEKDIYMVQLIPFSLGTPWVQGSGVLDVQRNVDSKVVFGPVLEELHASTVGLTGKSCVGHLANLKQRGNYVIMHVVSLKHVPYVHRVTLEGPRLCKCGWIVPPHR